MTRLSTVLVVDDENICLTVAKKLLEHLDLEVICTNNGAEAVGLYKQNMGKILCVLLDIQMPVMNGVDTFRLLKSIDKDVQVVIVSGFVNKKNKDLIDPLQPAGYMEKPIDLKDIEDVLLRLPQQCPGTSLN